VTNLQGRRFSSRTRSFLYAAPLVILTLSLVTSGLIIGWGISSNINLRARFVSPGGSLPNGKVSLLGTDSLGRDLLQEICVGAPISIFVAIVSVLVAVVVGSVIGLSTGLIGGWMDLVIMRLVDIQLAFPPLLLAIVLGAALGPSLINVIISLSVIRWAIFARLTRSLSLQLREKEFVEAARAIGASKWRIVSKHLWPNAFGAVIIVGTSQVGLQILAEAALSFVGFGITRPLISWGLLINEGKDYLSTAWWVSTFPGLILMLFVFSLALFGDVLKDRMSRRAEV